MNILPKTLLLTSLIAFALSLTGPGSDLGYGILKPMAALLFVIAFIIHVVACLDAAEYEADNRLRNELLKAGKPADPETHLHTAIVVSGARG